MPEGLSSSEVGKEIAEHKERHEEHAAHDHAGGERAHSVRDRYRLPQRTAAKTFDAKSEALFKQGQSDAGTADDYVRLTVILAAVLFLIGISSHFPIRIARYGLIGTASVLFVISVVTLLGLPGPPG